MIITKRDGAEIRPEYVNSFKTYAGNGEIVLEFSRVDLAATLETSTDGTDPTEHLGVDPRLLVGVEFGPQHPGRVRQRLGEPVVHPAAVLALLDQAGPLEVGEVRRHRRWGKPDHCGDLAHAQLTGAQQ